VEIRKYCPLYSVGDKLRIDGPRVIMGKGDSLCPYALSALMRYIPDLEAGVDPGKLGLARPHDGDRAYIPCGERCRYYKEGGCVVFRCQKNGVKLWRRKVAVAVGSKAKKSGYTRR